MIRFILVISLLLSFLNLHAQEADEGILYKDYTYLNHIRSVTFHPTGAPTSYPILPMNLNGEINIGKLQLKFDDLSGDINTYIYTVELCDKNWNPSDLSTQQYIDGYENENIDDYFPSASTVTPYIEYQLEIPNENLTLKLSGNYLLKVYEDEDRKRLAFTKRFLVVQNNFKIEGEIVPTFDPDKRETHHELDFYLDHEGQTLLNAKATFTATVLQNYRWESAIENISPIFLRDEKLVFDYSDQIIFGALRDFRQLDNRSFFNRSIDVLKIERFDDGWLVQNKPEEPRAFTIYNNRSTDSNGAFYLFNDDNIDGDKGDYSINQFKLNYPEEIENGDVYIYGRFTNYELDDEYLMEYNPDRLRYEGECLLKQGFYEYYYAVVKNGGEISLQEMESNLFETENDYTILIYHTPFGSQYDQLVSMTVINSSLRD